MKATLLLGLLAIALTLTPAHGGDWNLFGSQALICGEHVEPGDWNLFRAAQPADDQARPCSEWNFLGAGPVAAEDPRPELKCKILSTGCTLCHWFQEHGDAGLPYRLVFEVDDQVGEKQAPDGQKYGWPVFQCLGQDGRLWTIHHTGADLARLTRTWRRITGH